MVDVITIDGPASVGKSSLAKKISNYYNCPLLHSGRLYRAVALKIVSKKIKINDRNKIIKVAQCLSENDLNSSDLFTSRIDKIASKISARKYLRQELKSYQLAFPKKYTNRKKFVVIEGRDVGTEIFPLAKYKIFMWANARIRAKRRHIQIIKKGEKSSLSRVYREIIARDNKDINRKIAPLRPAVNSVLLDTSYLDIEQAFNAIKRIIK